MLATIDCTLNFLEMFTYSSVKIGTVEHESKVLFELKGQIEDRLSQMVN